MMGGAWYDQVLGDKTEEEVGNLAVEQVRHKRFLFFIVGRRLFVGILNIMI